MLELQSWFWSLKSSRLLKGVLRLAKQDVAAQMDFILRPKYKEALGSFIEIDLAASTYGNK